MLYDVSSARMLIGLVLNNPTILYNGRYKLNRSDFSPNLFHKTLFAIIERLAETGMEQIDEKAVCTFIESTEDYAVQREVLEDNEYLGFIKSIKEVVKTSDETIDYYYNNVRKFSLLRDYKNNGIDITSVYDELGDEDEQRRRLNDLTISEIIDTFDNMLGKIRKEYSVNSSVEEVKAGDGFEIIKEAFKETPFYGMSYQSEYLNAITRGQIKGQLACFTSPSACVDGETEYFNGKKWIPIKDYNTNDKVLQYNINGSAELVNPIRYINEPCDEMYHFETKYGLNQTLTKDHTIVFLKEWNNQLSTCTFGEMMDKQLNTKDGFPHQFITSFNYDGKGIDLTDSEIKIMCAVICDGTFTHLKTNSTSTLCRFHIKKDRKKNELRRLFDEAKIEWREKESTAEGYTDLYIYAPRREKEFTDYWYDCSQHQLQIICDNIIQWDGSFYKGKSRDSMTFSTTILNTANFVQFAFSACGHRAKINVHDRRGRIRKINEKEYITKSIDYVITISQRGTTGITGNIKGNHTITTFQKVFPIDGRKYCFEVPSHMLILRRYNNIFVTGNCGKTTIGIGDVCNVAAKRYYDYKSHKYIDNPRCVSTGALIIQFELDNLSEVNPKIVSFISGVPSPRILDGRYINDEESRVDEAIEVLKESNIYIAYMPNFTTKSIADCVKQYKVQHNIDYVFFDYIADNSAVNNELQSQSKVKIRTDQVLESLTDALKNIARENDVFIRTCTQSNFKVKENEILDESVIAGSRAVTNKLDVGAVITFPRKKELEEVAPLLPDNLPATHVCSIYKCRFGRYARNLKVWLNVDLGTGRVTDLLTTAWDNTLLEGDDKVPKMKLEKGTNE